MNTVRAKFVCSLVLEQTNEDSVNPQKTGESVELQAQYTGTPEDNTFAAATPSGNMNMYVSNPDVWGFFQQGSTYYLDITPAQ